MPRTVEELHGEIEAIRTRIRNARAKMSAANSERVSAQKELREAKDLAFLAAVEAKMRDQPSGQYLAVNVERKQRVDFATMQRCDIPEWWGRVEKVHRGRKHRGLWVRARTATHDWATTLTFVRASDFAKGCGAQCLVAYPSIERGDIS